jgi:hypothetical protein
VAGRRRSNYSQGRRDKLAMAYATVGALAFLTIVLIIIGPPDTGAPTESAQTQAVTNPVASAPPEGIPQADAQVSASPTASGSVVIPVPTSAPPIPAAVSPVAQAAAPRPVVTTRVVPQRSSPPTQPAKVYSAACTEVKAAHTVPVRRGRPGSQDDLDRNNGSDACES